MDDECLCYNECTRECLERQVELYRGHVSKLESDLRARECVPPDNMCSQDDPCQAHVHRALEWHREQGYEACSADAHALLVKHVAEISDNPNLTRDQKVSQSGAVAYAMIAIGRGEHRGLGGPRDREDMRIYRSAEVERMEARVEDLLGANEGLRTENDQLRKRIAALEANEASLKAALVKRGGWFDSGYAACEAEVKEWLLRLDPKIGGAIVARMSCGEHRGVAAQKDGDNG